MNWKNGYLCSSKPPCAASCMINIAFSQENVLNNYGNADCVVVGLLIVDGMRSDEFIVHLLTIIDTCGGAERA